MIFNIRHSFIYILRQAIGHNIHKLIKLATKTFPTYSTLCKFPRSLKLYMRINITEVNSFFFINIIISTYTSRTKYNLSFFYLFHHLCRHKPKCNFNSKYNISVLLLKCTCTNYLYQCWHIFSSIWFKTVLWLWQVKFRSILHSL